MSRAPGDTPSDAAPTRAGARPIITLTSDFGTTDFYVAAMKAVLLRHCPDAHLLDVTHQIARHDILAGAITLERALDAFPPGTVHLAVVDPGVGTDRRLLVTEINRQTVVCPDNGLITWAWRRLRGGQAHELTWRPSRPASHTFHGRDIMAPVSGMIAGGEVIASLARPMEDPVLLDVRPIASIPAVARVIHIDSFGNATTNVPHDALSPTSTASVCMGRRLIGRLMRTYGDAAPGKAIALIGSSGLLEIAVRDGSAARDLNLQVGDEITVE